MVCFTDVGTVRTWYNGPGILGRPSPAQRTMIQSVVHVQQWMATRGLPIESAVSFNPSVGRGEAADLRDGLETANENVTLDMAAEAIENTDSTLDMAAESPRSEPVVIVTTTPIRWSPARPPTPGASFLLSSHSVLPLQSDALMHLV